MPNIYILSSATDHPRILKKLYIYHEKLFISKTFIIPTFRGSTPLAKESEYQLKSDLNVNARMRTEIDLNECEHFLKAN